MQNTSKIKENSECRVVRLWKTKRRSDILQAIVEIDITSYNIIMNSDDKHLIVGLDRCPVYDGIDLVRCFKCSSFNHSSKFCKADMVCPRCSNNHSLADCPDSAIDRCINCVNYKALQLKGNQNVNIDCNHSSLDKNCVVYQSKLKSLKASIFGKQ